MVASCQLAKLHHYKIEHKKLFNLRYPVSLLERRTQHVVAVLGPASLP
jgi:hypothetical protein